MAGRRRYRVSERIREILGRALLDLTDPRFELVTITRVIVNRDLREAKVYWNVYGDSRRVDDTTAAFITAGGLLRRIVGEKLQIKFVPQLKFFYDDTLDTVAEVEKLLARVEEQA